MFHVEPSKRVANTAILFLFKPKAVNFAVTLKNKRNKNHKKRVIQRETD